MITTITPIEMQSLQKQYMSEIGIPSILLMEQAAQHVCDAMHSYSDYGKALFLCGPGNNGGDGLAAARIWKQHGGQSVVAVVTRELKNDVLLNYKLCVQMSIDIITIVQCSQHIKEFDVICDGLYGTGLNRDIDSDLCTIIEQINQSGVPIISVDIPSGLNGTTGQICGKAVTATETVTFHRPKQGLYLKKAANYTGRITVADILIPQSYGNVQGIHVLTPDDIQKLIPNRKKNSHKGTYGKVVMFVGSIGMAGAAALCARACIKTGAGLTTILCRQSILPILQVLVPGAVCIPLDEENGTLTEKAAILATDALKHAQAAAVGCGLGQSKDLLPVLKVFTDAACPVVWDADALNILSKYSDMLPLSEKDVITPHPGEASRLLHTDISVVSEDMSVAAKELHCAVGCNVLLKGSRSIMTDGTDFAVNAYGSPAMAKGGSGDILTGIMTSVIAQQLGHNRLEQIQLAALLHGMAGLRAAQQYGEYSVLPQQFVEAIRLDDNFL